MFDVGVPFRESLRICFGLPPKPSELFDFARPCDGSAPTSETGDGDWKRAETGRSRGEFEGAGEPILEKGLLRRCAVPLG